MKSNFKSRVQNIVRKIKKGNVLTYKQVAALAGSPGASRAVGNIMKGNFDKTIPCHRVIGSDGNLVGYAGELWRKKWLLDFEIGDKNGKQMGLVY